MRLEVVSSPEGVVVTEIDGGNKKVFLSRSMPLEEVVGKMAGLLLGKGNGGFHVPVYVEKNEPVLAGEEKRSPSGRVGNTIWK